MKCTIRLMPASVRNLVVRVFGSFRRGRVRVRRCGTGSRDLDSVRSAFGVSCLDICLDWCPPQ
eukprot:6620755-Lingulodinium_polyedra.AAC.1